MPVLAPATAAAPAVAGADLEARSTSVTSETAAGVVGTAAAAMAAATAAAGVGPAAGQRHDDAMPLGADPLQLMTEAELDLLLRML